MLRYKELNREQLKSIQQGVRKDYDKYKEMNLSLDMSRGKPSIEQLSLSNDIIKSPYVDCYKDSYGIDCRNYGGLDGLPEMKKIFADILEVTPDEVIVGGNSSLTLMFDNIASNMTHGVRDGEPWANQGKIKFICPVPGYDRHFSICDYFHIKMIPVKMLSSGPDMDEVERLVQNDPLIKGMWCVPKYSNPDGITYSNETVMRIAALKPAADDFRLYWDNAYIIHHLYEAPDEIPNILYECENAGNPNMPLIFTSFSKISFSGAAVSAFCASRSNIEYISKRLSVQSIGPDKLNQLRHIKFFENIDKVKSHMKLHADIIRPKFEVVLSTLERELALLDICTWTKPNGGYFISFYSEKYCAKRIVDYCKKAGVTLTPAGATYPYGLDVEDRNIRIAPSFPTLEEISMAIEIFCTAVKLATLDELLKF